MRGSWWDEKGAPLWACWSVGPSPCWAALGAGTRSGWERCWGMGTFAVWVAGLHFHVKSGLPSPSPSGCLSPLSCIAALKPKLLHLLILNTFAVLKRNTEAMWNCELFNNPKENRSRCESSSSSKVENWDENSFGLYFCSCGLDLYLDIGGRK